MYTSRMGRQIEKQIRAAVAKHKRKGVWLTVCGSAGYEDLNGCMCVIVEAWGRAGIGTPPEPWKLARAKRCFDRLLKEIGPSRVRLSIGNGQYRMSDFGGRWKKVG